MSKARQAAEERYPLNGDATNIAIRATLQTGYIQGRLDALPEVPDDAVIEAMAQAAFPSNWLSKTSQLRARAAYAALRGAMQ